MTTTKKLTGQAECLLPGGEAVVRSPDGVFLVSNAVPGDEVCFHEQEKRRGSRRGVLDDVLKPASTRVESICGIAAECGGCALQYLDKKAHAGIKSAWVYESFDPFVEEGTQWQPIGQTEPRLRRRARWWRAEDGQGVYLGFLARTSHKVVRHECCHTVLPELDMARQAIQGLLPPSVQAVQITALHDGMHVVPESNLAMDFGLTLPEIPYFPEWHVQYWWRDPAGTKPLSEEKKPLHDLLPAGDGNVLLRIGPDDFVQGQMEGNAAIVKQVQNWAADARRIVDLFAGAGNLSLPLAYSTGAEVLGADVRPQSVQAANANASRLSVAAEFHAANLFEAGDLSAYAGADVLILDPPRKGAKSVCQAMGILLPKKIIMLSCDVAAGRRDAAILHRHGYRMHALRAFDLFPYAGHVEAMSLWVQV